MTRISRVIDKMREAGLKQILVSDPLSIKYLTGTMVHPGERMYALLIKGNGDLTLFANRLFNIEKLPCETVWYSDNENSIELIKERINVNEPLGIDKEWPARFLIPLLDSCSNLNVRLSSDCIDRVRAVKDEDEIEKMKEASRINDMVILKARDHVHEGITEKELAAFIDQEYLNCGADGNSFPAIVSFGRTAADPHHMPDDTVLKDGDVILIDMGCIKNGYCSDMTRTFFYRTTDEKQVFIHDLVRKANETAENVIKPGMRLCDIDAAARNIISDAGYGQFFTHRLGHFIGQAVHEKGDVSSSYTDRVEPGMIFSIEPGVYLPDEFGVRIEDLVLVTEDGCEVLNKVNKKYEIIK